MTVMNSKFDTLGQLLGCYFHQDWQDEFDSDLEAIQAIIESEPQERILSGIVEIDLLLAEHRSEESWRTILTDQLGCYFDPSSEGMSYVDWLYRVKEALSHRK